MADLGEKNWRRAREASEHETYLELRRNNARTGFKYSENQLREQARKQANEAARLAIRMRNEQATA
jgi:hypothetical protein